MSIAHVWLLREVVVSSANGSADAAASAFFCMPRLEANPPSEHFCRKCGAPLCSYATTAPLEQVYALGWMYRKALSQPARPIVLLGV